MKHINIIFFAIAMFLGFNGLSQDDDGWLYYPPKNSDSTKTVTFDGSQKGSLKVNKDSRIDVLTKFVGTPVAPDPVQIEGYRIQIFFDREKDKADQARSTFMSVYRDMRTYVEWVAPNYRVRVGNFRTELEAEEVKAQISAYFTTANVIQTKIELPKLTSTTTVTQ